MLIYNAMSILYSLAKPKHLYDLAKKHYWLRGAAQYIVAVHRDTSYYGVLPIRKSKKRKRQSAFYCLYFQFC